MKSVRHAAARRRLFQAALGVVAWAGSIGQAAEFDLVQDLRAAVRQAAQQRRPLVVMVSLPNCPFCRVARDNFLTPLVRDRVVAVTQVDMRSTAMLIGVDGVDRTHDAQTRLWGVRVAPTLLFLGPDGREVAPRLEGASIPDFYGAYLDERVAKAAQALGY